jgi:exopolysaccharide production protein ExoY
MASVKLPPVPFPRSAGSEEAAFTLGVGWFERLLSAILLVLISPLLLLIAMAILLLSGKSPLIAHRRVGQYGSELWVLKFRTMWGNGVSSKAAGIFSVEMIDDVSGPRSKTPADERVASPFARFCRRHSLDELPQIFNVLEGRMSLVGPRPVTRPEVDEIYGTDGAEVLSVKPGLTGLWQISGRNRLSAAQRCALDLAWVRSQSLSLYLAILLRTIPKLLYATDTW